MSGLLSLSKPPSVAEDQRLFLRYRQCGDEQARDALVQRWMPLARRLASGFNRGREPLEDLEQVAFIGLVKAIDRFEADRGTAFTTFAVPTITGELKRHLRDHTWLVRVPRALKDLSTAAARAEADLEARLGRAPTAAELATETGAPLEQILELRIALDAQRGESLDADPRDRDATAVKDRVGVQERGFERAEARATLDVLLRRLNDREREILRLRFEEDLSQEQIAIRVGCSQMHVSRLIRGALKRLSV
jgi:RNA polymerase sigma-B factor